MLTRSLGAALALALATSAPAAAAEELNYDFVGLNYRTTSLDQEGGSVDGSGMGLSGSFGVTDRVFLEANYAADSFDHNIDVTEWAAAVGYHAPIADAWDVIVSAGLGRSSVDVGLATSDENFSEAAAGLRGKVSEQVELEGSARYVDYEKKTSDTIVSVGALYELSEALSVGASYASGDEADTISAGIRYYY